MAVGKARIMHGRPNTGGKLETMSNITPKKSLGQHWLHDVAVLAEIADAATVNVHDTVLEIGPGLGTLTSVLLRRGARVIAVEFDRDLAANLRRRVKGGVSLEAIDNLKIVESDILQFDLRQLPAGYKVVANIPYYLTSNLIRILCESTNPFSQAALLIQKEVAERVCAKPGAMSLLSVSAQYYCEVELDVFVPARLFTPPPKVNSQVLVLTKRPEPLFPGIDEKRFFRLVRAGFSQRRKTLVNALSGGLAIDKQDAARMVADAGLSASIRAQNLSLSDWKILYNQLD